MAKAKRRTGDEIDDNVKSLCQALNNLPGIYTCFSCGGHANHVPPQGPEGEFYVSFEVDVLAGGWLSFELINRVVHARNAVRSIPHGRPPCGWP